MLLAGASGRLPVEEGMGSSDLGFDNAAALFSARASRALSARSEALPMAKDVELQESLTTSLQYICLKCFLYSNRL